MAATTPTTPTEPTGATTPALLFTVTDDREQLEQHRNNLLLTDLLREKWIGAGYMYQYNGFWLFPALVKGINSVRNHFLAQDTDVLLATHPKSGTTWLKALAFTLVNRNIHSLVNDFQNHPLIDKNPHALVQFKDLFPSRSPADQTTTQEEVFSSDPLGRLYATHYPFSLLPESVLNSGCKIVYLCRNVKDVIVSYWYYCNHGRQQEVKISFEQYVDLFCRGVSHFGPFWDHVLDYWRASLDMPHKVLYLKYEDLRQEPAPNLKRIAEFMGCPISQEEEAAGLVDKILELCSFDHLKNLDVNKKGTCGKVRNEAFFREGKVGDWKNYLTSEMAERLDQVTAEKFHGSGLNL